MCAMTLSVIINVIENYLIVKERLLGKWPDPKSSNALLITFRKFLTKNKESGIVTSIWQKAHLSGKIPGLYDRVFLETISFSPIYHPHLVILETDV